MPTISLTVDSSTATKIAAAFAKYYNEHTGYVDGSGSPLTGSALIKEVYVRHTKQIVRNAKLDDGNATASQSADTEANSIVIS